MASPVVHGTHGGVILDSLDTHDIMECARCGYKHLVPVPTDEELRAFYEQQYYQVTKKATVDEDQLEHEHRGIAFEERLWQFDRSAPGKRLLDVGCGTGQFLQWAQQRGWSVKGVEPSGHAAAQARAVGLDVDHGTLEDLCARNPEQFSVVHLKNVLEHLPRPMETLALCHRLLRPGGVLYLEVPNDYELFQRLGCRMLGERKSWLCVPDHINYFNFRSLAAAVRRAGFQVIRRDTTFPIYAFLCLGKNFIKDKALGKRLHQWRVNMELSCEKRGLGPLRRLAYRALALLGLGRTAILYCRKPSAPHEAGASQPLSPNQAR